MRGLILGLLLLACFAEEFLVTKEYTDYLKRHVDWEVQEYEDNIFKGWTDSEIKQLLGDQTVDLVNAENFVNDKKMIYPAELNWVGADCTHKIRNQGNCGSCWAFSVAGMVSDRCCMNEVDHGWLSPQELVSCDWKNHGCEGGDRTFATQFVISNNGLVHDECFAYQAKKTPCPKKCEDGKDWKKSHVCKCKAYKICSGHDNIIACLATGPLAVGMKVYADFMLYKSGIYKWDRRSELKGYHAIKMVGYGEEYWNCANSWGENWGEKGYFRILKGECDIEERNPVICTY